MDAERGGGTAVQAAAPVGWPLYFAEESYTASDRRALLIRELGSFLESDVGWEQVSTLEPYGSELAVEVDYEALKTSSGMGDLAAAMEWQPEEGLACVGAAIFQALFGAHSGRLFEMLGEQVEPCKVAVRLVNCPGFHTSIRSIKASSIGKLVTLRGTVVRSSAVRSLITSMDFVCGKCGGQQRAQFPGGKFVSPPVCGLDGCRSRTLAPDRLSASSEDWQRIRLQELSPNEGGAAEEGRVPRTIEVELNGGLVDNCAIGDVITVVGLVKVTSTDGDAGGGGGGGGGGKGGGGGGPPAAKKAKCLFLLYLEAVSVTNPAKRAGAPGGWQRPASNAGSSIVQVAMEPSGHHAAGPAFSTRDLQFVLRFAQEYQGDQLRMLVHALCPLIYGHELVKAGLLLALLGGVRKAPGAAGGARGAAAPAAAGGEEGKGTVPVRGDIHVLVVGDPGMGKSQMLQACAAAAPRGVYICGNTSTSAGLTVSVVRDPLTGDAAFEAGAVVLADRGVCCVDEFDKMTAEHQALLGAMEQQEVSVAKAGLCASLPARTAVLAAANPAGGHYNRAKTVGENLKMSSAMLSRFDLIFILVDRPDEALDARLSEHVIALHSGTAGRAEAARQRLQDHCPSQPLLLGDGRGGDGGGAGGSSSRPSLVDRLKVYHEADGQPLPVQLLRKYIAYCRAYCHPVLTDEAKAVLQRFYMQLRQAASGSDGIPITTRQLESMVRLAEARARVELREAVTKEDAEDVVELMKESLYDLYLDESGVVDFRRAGGKSKQAEAKRFLGALARRADARGNAMFTVAELYEVADDLELNVADMGDFFDELNNAGELLKKGPQLYQVRCAVGGPSQASRQPQGSRLFASSQQSRY